VPVISIVIPVLNGGDKFRHCLEAVSAADPPAFEIVVVNDGGTEDLSFVQSEFGGRVVNLERTGGPAGARNRGVRETTGDLLLFIDADVIVRPDIIRQVSAIFEQEPNVSAVFGSYDDQPLEANFLSQYRNLLHHFVHQNGKPEASTFWGACGAIRREDFEAVGGFDEARYPLPSIEDVDLGYRLKNAGKRIRLCAELQVKHLKRWSAASVIRTDFFQRGLPWTELIFRERNLLNDLNTSTANRISVVMALLLLGTAVLSFLLPSLLYATAACAIILLWLNRSLYFYFRKKRGTLFAAMTIPWHWLLFLESGVAFATGLLLYRVLRTSKPAPLAQNGQ
jgi:GT2 family glycosyltransferase